MKKEVKTGQKGSNHGFKDYKIPRMIGPWKFHEMEENVPMIRSFIQSYAKN